jgi:hypothetical protein
MSPRETTAEAIYVALLPDGPMIVLAGTSGLVWDAACSDDGGTIAARVAAHVDRNVEEISAAVDACLADLVEKGLLREVI